MKGQRWPYDLKSKWMGFSKGTFYPESIQTYELNLIFWNPLRKLTEIFLKIENVLKFKRSEPYNGKKAWQARAALKITKIQNFS